MVGKAPRHEDTRRGGRGAALGWKGRNGKCGAWWWLSVEFGVAVFLLWWLGAAGKAGAGRVEGTRADRWTRWARIGCSGDVWERIDLGNGQLTIDNGQVLCSVVCTIDMLFPAERDPTSGIHIARTFVLRHAVIAVPILTARLLATIITGRLPGTRRNP